MAVVIDRNLNCKVNDTITVWGIFDAHVDNRWSEANRLQRDIESILADPLARCVIGGDFNDMIFHGEVHNDRLRVVLLRVPTVVAGGGYAARPETRPVTKFERRGLRLGHQVFDLLFERTKRGHC